MIKGWILFSSLVLSVLFRWYRPFTGTFHFLLTNKTLDMESGVYYTMEHIVAIAVALCLLIKDSTPKWLLWLFFGIMCADFFHYICFLRDSGPGWNLIKVVVFGLPLLYIELKIIWIRYKH